MNRSETDQFTCLVKAIDPEATLVRHWSLTGGVSAQTSALEIRRANGYAERLVVRAHGKRDFARDPDIALHEFQLLHALYESGLPVPRPIYVHQAGGILDGPAVVVEFIEGDIIIAPRSLSGFIAELAYWLGRIHRFDLTTTDLSFLVANDYQGAHRFKAKPGDSPLILEMCAVLDQLQPVAFRNQSVLLHGDFWRGNLLWRDGKLAAIIDWEDAMIGDPIVDLSRARLELHWTHGEMARERFTAHYLSYRDIDVDDLAFWDLAMALGFARDLSGWGLPEPREREMYQALERFVQNAIQQLAIDRS